MLEIRGNDKSIAKINQACTHSRSLKRQLAVCASLQQQLLEHLDRSLNSEDLRNFLQSRPCENESQLAQSLRALRAWVFAHVMVRDLSGDATLAEVTATFTSLAETAIDSAQTLHHRQLCERYGVPRDAQGIEQELIVIGMGKLGGGELNVSSDIDLIFVYPQAARTDGAKSVDGQEFFSKLGQKIIQTLSQITAEGFVFRVDMRLRPNGDSGPLVSSFDMLEDYFITQGREWERYAWIKARPLSGTQHDGLQQLVRPFVFRKYLDFGAIEAMRGLHSQIRHEVSRRDMADNIKLGPGGIREIEFIAQVFQLIRGGREANLQIRPTQHVLALLDSYGLLSIDAVAELNDAYHFLRRLEHRIQYLDDAQTHDIPVDAGDRKRLATSMGFADSRTMMATLETHRERVSKRFEAVFAGPANAEHELDALWQHAQAPQHNLQPLQKLGFADPAATGEALRALHSNPRYQSLNESARNRFDSLVPRILEGCAAQPSPDTTFAHLVKLLESICRRAAYLALLQQYPHALDRLIVLASRSSWGTDYLAQHPILLDELLDARAIDEAPAWTEFEQQLDAQLERHAGDTERQMDLMREAHHSAVFSLLGKDLAGYLSVEQLGDHLSELADIILRQSIVQCWQRLNNRHREHPAFIIAAYGKLGGKEMGYASDLDLVFLFDDTHEDATQIYARLAQRIVTWLTSRTPAGILFETDLRLRPNGEAGLLVTSLNAFEQYQLREHGTGAWMWEHQALTRARFCAGDRDLGQRFEALRERILREPRDPAQLQKEVWAMRRKMYAAHPRRAQSFDLKHDPGGLIDLEFCVQYLVLAHAHAHPELTRNLGNITLLQIAAAQGLIPVRHANAAADAYRRLRRIQHTQHLNQLSNYVPLAQPDDAPQAIQALWQLIFGAQGSTP